MAKVKLSLRELTIPEKVQLSRQIAEKMQGNPLFPTPSPTLAEIVDAADNLEAAYNTAENSRREATQATAAQDRLGGVHDTLLTRLGNYVESTAKEDEEGILSAGMQVRADAAPIGDMPQPQNLSATDGDLDGEIDLAWNRVRGAASYVVQTSLEGETWAGDKVSTKSSYVYGGLPMRVKHWFRVAAVGAAGQGPWSNPATGTAV